MEAPKFLNALSAHEEHASLNPDDPCGAYIVLSKFYIHFGYWTCTELLKWRKITIAFGEAHRGTLNAGFIEHRLTTMCAILEDSKMFGSTKLHKVPKYFLSKLPEILKDYKAWNHEFDQEVLSLDNAEEQVSALIAQFVRYAYVGFYVLKFIHPKDYNGFHVQTHLPVKQSGDRWTVTMKPNQCDKCLKTCKVLKCSLCRLATYCSKECQRAHWACHKATCKKWRQTIMENV
jgi:hypothetical protein